MHGVHGAQHTLSLVRIACHHQMRDMDADQMGGSYANPIIINNNMCHSPTLREGSANPDLSESHTLSLTLEMNDRENEVK